jgi:hypothetical protein
MKWVKESLRNTIEVLSDEEACQILEFIRRLRTTSDVSPTLRRLAIDPAFEVPSEGFRDFSVVEPIQGKGVPASKLLVENRR